MRKSNLLLLAAAALFNNAKALNASIDISYQAIDLISISSTTPNGILSGNGSGATASPGWHGVLISAVADAASQKVAGFDLNTGTFGVTSYQNQGFFAQRWLTSGDDGSLLVNSTIQANTPVGTTSSVVAESFFSRFTDLGFSATAALAEDNNLANGSNGPYNRNPVPDVAADTNAGVPGLDYGVGTFLKGAGNFTTNNVTGGQTIPIAFVIVPNGTYVMVSGIFIDGQSPAHAWLVTTSENLEQPPPVDLGPIPEPTSLLTFSLGSLILLRRNRRVAR